MPCRSAASLVPRISEVKASYSSKFGTGRDLPGHGEQPQRAIDVRHVRPWPPSPGVGSHPAVPEPDGPGVMDGHQGNGAGCEPDGVDSVPPGQQRPALVLPEGLWAEEQSWVEGTEHIGGSSGADGRTYSRHNQ